MSEIDTKDRPGVIMPPPLIFFGFVLVGIGLDLIWPIPLIPADMQILGGVILIVMAVSLLGASLMRFRHARTNVETWKPSIALVTRGPYRVTRNPIYVAFGLALLGLACALDNLWLVVLWPVMIVTLDIGVIRREERYLESKFGDAYRVYCRNVRRWI